MKNEFKEVAKIESSVAQYLTFISSSGESGVETIYADENIWLTQKMMGVLYNVSVATINEHIKKIYLDNELTEESTIRKFRIVQNEGKRQVGREIIHYNLQTIIAVGYKVNSEKAVQFRKWATDVLQQYTIKAYVMDDERLKKGHMFTDKYFEEQLERVREIRLSERKFYQKITDIYATSSDYDKNSKSTKRFFATVQNKLHWAIHGHTASELIVERANAENQNMGLSTWKDAPNGKIQKFDVVVAKNYLTEDEMKQLSRIVSAYLDLAEDMAIRKIPMTMADWEIRLNRFIEMTDREVLKDAGKVTAELAKQFAETEFEKYRIIQDSLFKSDFDEFVLEEGGLNE